MNEKLSYEELRRRVRELEETLERFSRQEQATHSRLDRLTKLSRIDEALRCSQNLDIILWEVLGQVLDILDCDRAWLLNPCDPEAPSWRIRMERTAPGYQGLKGKAASVPMTAEAAETLRTVLNAEGPVIHGPEGHPLPEKSKHWRIKSQLSMAIRPEGERPWQFGVHQCSYPRAWSPEEKALLRETGHRIAMTMSLIPAEGGGWDGQGGGGENSLLLEAQTRLGEALANGSDISSGLDRCLEAALASSGMEAGGIYLFDKTGKAVLASHFNLSEEFLGRVGENSLDTPLGRKIVEGTALFLRVAELHSPLKDILAAEQIQSLAVLPVRYEGQTVGCMNIASRIMPEVLGEARHSLLMISLLAGNAIGRIRSLGALQESEARYRTLVGALPLGVAEIGVDGTILFSNSAHDAIYDCEPGSIVGRNVADLVRGEKEKAKLREYFQMLASREPAVTPWTGTCVRRDGTPVDIRVDWGYRRNSSGTVAGYSAIVTDVTERRRVQQALQDSEEKFRKFAEESPHMILIESAGTIIYVNKQCEILMGYERMDYYNGSFSFTDLVAPQDREKVAEAYGRLFDGGSGVEIDCRLISREDRKVDTIVASRIVSYRGGTAVLSIITDITDRREAERALVASEERYRSLVEQSHEIIFSLDREGRFVMINPAFESVTGFSVAGWLGRHLRDLVHPDDHTILKEGFAALSVGEKLPRSEIRVQSKSGGLIALAFSSVPIMKAGVMSGVWGIARNVTGRRKAEEDRRNLAALREREGVSRWLHDHLGADLYNIVLLADSIQRKGNVDKVVLQQLDWITETSRSALSSIRNYLDFAGSSGGSFTDLVRSIEGYGASVLKPLEIEYSFRRQGDLGSISLTAIQSFNVYLIFKEALTNVVKHARATRVSVVAALEEGVLSIVVEDNGTGMAAGESSHGHGRLNIRARAEELGAGLAITSSQEGGTRVSLSLAVSR